MSMKYWKLSKCLGDKIIFRILKLFRWTSRNFSQIRQETNSTWKRWWFVHDSVPIRCLVRQTRSVDAPKNPVYRLFSYAAHSVRPYGKFHALKYWKWASKNKSVQGFAQKSRGFIVRISGPKPRIEVYFGPGSHGSRLRKHLPTTCDPQCHSWWITEQDSQRDIGHKSLQVLFLTNLAIFFYNFLDIWNYYCGRRSRPHICFSKSLPRY